MLHSLRSFCQPLGGLDHEATIFFKRLASLLSTKGGIAILLLWAGFVVVYPFLCCARQLPVFMVPSCHPVTLIEFLLQWTW